MLSEVQNVYWVRERTKLYEWESTMNGNENPREGGLTGLRTGGKVA